MMHSSPSAPPPNYVKLRNLHGQPYPQQQQVSKYNGHHSSGSCCIRCICCFYCLLFLLIIALVGAFIYAYTIYNPTLPSYQITEFNVASFDVKPDFSVYTNFQVTIRAENPNQIIGLRYGEDNNVAIMFKDSVLCTGKLSNFHQGHKSVIMIKILLKGNSTLGSGLQEALKESEQAGRISLFVSMRVPIFIVIASRFPLRQFIAKVNCKMVVNSLKPSKKPEILSTEYSYDFEF
ncbi:hypothetical protein Ancab_007847 [Ancistrocladus abbreviatus]